VSVVRFKFRCNILINGKIIKEMPGSVADRTPCRLTGETKLGSHPTPAHYRPLTRNKWFTKHVDITVTNVQTATAPIRNAPARHLSPFTVFLSQRQTCAGNRTAIYGTWRAAWLCVCSVLQFLTTYINLLAEELFFFLILAHAVYKM